MNYEPITQSDIFASLLQINIQTVILVTIVILIAIVIRYLFVRFLNTLEKRNIITITTRVLITRILDIVIIISIAIVTVQIITTAFTQYIIVLVVGLFVFILFYYEIREFTAFIAVQLERRVLKTWIEVYPPNSNNVIRGRIVEIQPFSSIIEDIYGNKMSIANSILLHSLIREYRPNIQLKITIIPKEILNSNEIFKSMKDLSTNTTLYSYDVYYIVQQLLSHTLSTSPFRIDEQSIMLKNISKDLITFTIKLTPHQIPLRKIDIYKLIKEIFQRFPENAISIEVLD
ncbi:MAG: hypothetical protein ACP5GU_04410 [Thermoprotei archaeon]|jgi:hypothetical protein